MFISSTVAKQTNQKNDYIKPKGIDDEYSQRVILNYLEKFGRTTRANFKKILLDKLLDVLDE